MANLSFFKGIETKILGHKVSSPIAVAPVEGWDLARFNGQQEMEMAAIEKGVCFTMPVGSKRCNKEDQYA